MCSVSSVMYPYPLGNSAEGHAPVFSMTVSLGNFLEASLVAHIYLGLGNFFVAICRNSQSTKW